MEFVKINKLHTRACAKSKIPRTSHRTRVLRRFHMKKRLKPSFGEVEMHRFRTRARFLGTKPQNRPKKRTPCSIGVVWASPNEGFKTISSEKNAKNPHLVRSKGTVSGRELDLSQQVVEKTTKKTDPHAAWEI